KTAVRRCREEPASARFHGQMFIILRWLKTEQRKFETILTAGFAVATAGIAAGFGENRHDLVGKVDRRNIFELFDRRRERGGQFGFFCLSPSDGERAGVRGSDFGGDRSCSFGQRRDSSSLAYLNHPARRSLIANFAGVIPQ